jgi:5-methyltetrahydrofolate--homocysteine methyltransferase
VKKDISDLIKEKILVLDGAMGTMIQKYRLQEEDYRGERFRNHTRQQKGNNDLLSVTRPDIIGSIYRSYLEAGADIITTNTFNSNRISMSDYGMEELVYELNVASARLAAATISEYESATGSSNHYIAGTWVLQTVLPPCHRM